MARNKVHGNIIVAWIFIVVFLIVGAMAVVSSSEPWITCLLLLGGLSFLVGLVLGTEAKSESTKLTGSIGCTIGILIAFVVLYGGDDYHFGDEGTLWVALMVFSGFAALLAIITHRH